MAKVNSGKALNQAQSDANAAFFGKPQKKKTVKKGNTNGRKRSK